MQKNEQKKDKFFRIITVLLIIIIIILLFFSRFGKINNYPVPTGNVDVFDIDVDIDYANVSHGNTNYNKDTSTNTAINIGTSYSKNIRTETSDNNQYTNKIAPGVSNTYHFVVHNSSKMELKYYVEMYENSEYQVNLRYRLKRNNNYVIGNDNNWVTADELKTAFKNIKDSSSDNYSLDWKWFDNDNVADTKAGKNMTSLYKLNIRFYFEAIDA